MLRSRLFFLAVMIGSLSGACSTISNFFAGDDHKVAERNTEGASSDESEQESSDIELKVAKLNAKIEELEQSVRQHKERQMLLEKTLMLGVLPEDLKQVGGKQKPNPLSSEGIEFEAGVVAVTEKPSPPILPQRIESLTDDQRRIYESELAKAQAEFNAGRYGEAIVSYEAIGRKYGSTVTNGNERYWVGVSWYYLKDFASSKKHLEGFIQDASKSALVPRARLYLAFCERDQGLVRQAQNRLKVLLEDFPDSDVSESVQFELKKLEERL